MLKTADLTAATILRESQSTIQKLLEDIRNPHEIQNHLEFAIDLCKEVEIHSRILGYVVCSIIPNALFKNQFSKFLNKEDGAIKRLVSNLRLNFGDYHQLEDGCHLLVNKLEENLKNLFKEEESQIHRLLQESPIHDLYLGAELGEMHKKMSLCPPVYQTMDLEVPIEAVFDQLAHWASYNSYSKLIKKADRTDSSHVTFLIQHDGKNFRWTAEIYEIIPNFRMAWTSFDGMVNEGSVSLRSLTNSSTRMLLELAVKPLGMAEESGAVVGMVSRVLSSEIQRFKEYLESISWETRKWHGNIEELLREQGHHSDSRVTDVFNLDEATPMDPHGPKDFSSLA